jgi:hypothetical protein
LDHARKSDPSFVSRGAAEARGTSPTEGDATPDPGQDCDASAGPLAPAFAGDRPRRSRTERAAFLVSSLDRSG